MSPIAPIVLLQSTIMLLGLVQASTTLPASIESHAITLGQQVIAQVPTMELAPISSSLSADTLSGSAPLTVHFSELVNVPSGSAGDAVMFFGDTSGGKPTSDTVTRVSPDRYQENWVYLYSTPGEYNAQLVLTTQTDVTQDPLVRSDPHYYKNVILRTLHVSVQ